MLGDEDGEDLAEELVADGAEVGRPVHLVRGTLGDPDTDVHLLDRPSPHRGLPDEVRELLGQRLPEFLAGVGDGHERRLRAGCTLATRHDLAYWRGETGDAVGAVAAYTDLLEDQLRVLGPNHPDTLATRHNLAWGRGETGDPAGAVAAYTSLLEDRVRVLGPDNPGTLATRHSLARMRGEMGDAVGAVGAYTDLLEDQLRVLGPNHPDTLATRHNLARIRGETGDPAGER